MKPELPDLPKPKKQEGGGLEEVERALSVLGGRHPEAVRLEREMQQASAERRKQADAEGRVEASKRVRRLAVRSALAIVLAGAAYEGYAMNTAHAVTVARLAGPLAPYAAAGFGGHVEGTFLHPERLETDVDEGMCVVVVAAGPGGASDVTIQRDGEPTKSDGPLAFCTCAREHVVAETPHEGGGYAVALARTEAKGFGSTFGFARAGLAPKVMPSPCAEEQLDGWLARSKGERRAAPGEEADDATWLGGTKTRDALVAAGFHAVAHSPETLPFVMVDLPKETCALTFADAPKGKDAPKDGTTISLRTSGGMRVREAHDVLAFCSAKGGTYTAWPSAPHALTVIAAPAKRAGGRLGLSEIVSHSGLAADGASAWIANDDLAWDATTAARASGVPDPTPIPDYSAGNRPEVRDARVVSLSLGGGASVGPDTTKDLLFYACERDLKGAVVDLCVQDAPMRWHDTSAKGKSAGAEAQLPFWLSSLAQVHDPDLIKEEVRLLAMARRLESQGFDPTVLEAVTELPDGVDIQGRAGEDAVVAFTLSPHVPFASPCTNGPAWSLDGEPHIVPLAAGEHVVMKPRVPSAVPPAARRTVVFRRSKSPG